MANLYFEPLTECPNCGAPSGPGSGYGGFWNHTESTGDWSYHFECGSVVRRKSVHGEPYPEKREFVCAGGEMKTEVMMWNDPRLERSLQIQAGYALHPTAEISRRRDSLERQILSSIYAYLSAGGEMRPAPSTVATWWVQSEWERTEAK